MARACILAVLHEPWEPSGLPLPPLPLPLPFPPPPPPVVDCTFPAVRFGSSFWQEAATERLTTTNSAVTCPDNSVRCSCANVLISCFVVPEPAGVHSAYGSLDLESAPLGISRTASERVS